MPLIELDDVHRSFGNVTALDGVSLSVPRGTALGLVGTNGAGKTTLFRLLVGLDTPDAGTVRVAGRDPTDGPAVRRVVGYLPEHAEFDPRLTGRDVLQFHARQRDVPPGEIPGRVSDLLETVGLGNAGDRRVGGYSNGMNRRLALATLLVGDPDALLLDEPTASLDPTGVETFHDLVDRITAETRMTVVVASHVLSEVERLCDRVAILDDGQLVTEGPLDALTAGTGHTTVRFRVDEDVSADDVAAFATRQGVDLVDATGATYEVACAGADAYDVVAALHDAFPIASFEVDRPALADAFADIVGGGADG